MNTNQSIHPRMDFPLEKRKVLNTCKRPKRSSINRRIRAIEEHMEQHPRDSVSAAHISLLKAKLGNAIADDGASQ